MKKFSKLMTTLLVVALSLMMFGTTTFAAAPSGATWTPTVSKSGSNVTEGQVTSGDTYGFTLTYDSAEAWGALTAPTAKPITEAMNITATGNIDGTNKATGSGTAITFTQPGIYNFKFKETSTSNANVTMDSTEYVVKVYVAYATDSNGVPTSQLVIKQINQVNGDNKKVSTDGTLVATNTAKTDLKSLTVSKTVTGQTTAATGTDFTFTVKISGVTDGFVYPVVYSDATGTHPATITSGTDTTITLQGGQNFKISGLPETATYSVTETQNDKYTTTVATDTAAAVSGYIATGTMTADHTVAYTNTSDITPPTAFLINNMPYIAVAVIALAGIAVLMMKKRKTTHDEF